MLKILLAARRGMLLVAAAITLISCASGPSTGIAGDVERVRVLVIGQDDHPVYIRRDDPAFHRVMTELQDAMLRRGFDVVDEDMIAADLNWHWANRRDRIDIMEVSKLANASEDARNRVRAIATFSIDARRRELSFTNKYKIRVSGQIYDVASNRFLGSFELPEETVSGPRCLETACAASIVGDRARDIATSIGDVLATKLAHLVEEEEDEFKGGRGLKGRYTVTMRHINKRTAMEIISVMAEEFPGYRDHELIRRSSKLRKYSYVTKAPAHKLEKWLELLLTDMGMDVEKDVMLQVRDGQILIEGL